MELLLNESGRGSGGYITSHKFPAIHIKQIVRTAQQLSNETYDTF